MAELPSGTVTFLFTDVEGSTRLLKQLRDRYGQVLAEHRRILRAAFEEHGGQEIDTQGDAFFVAFRKATDAALAAGAAQRALAEHPWPDGVECRVRMGMHTGEPSVGDEGYHGLGVHRAARITAAGHGGQILLSQATCSVLEDDELPGIRLRDLGQHRLKDLDRPEHIYQLDIEGLPLEFPPLRTAEAPTAYTGHEAELEKAARAVVWRARLQTRRWLAGAIAGFLVAGGLSAVLVLILGSSGTARALSHVDANAVGLISSATGRISEEVPVGATPSHLAVGEGAVWVTNADDDTVSRIDPLKRIVAQTISVGSSPSGITTGNGAVWVANSLDSTVSRIDPVTNTVVQTIPVGNGPVSIAYAAGSVWVANTGDDTITTIDADSGRPTKTLPIAAAELAFGAGTLWASQRTANRVARIDPTTGSVVQTIPVGNGPAGLAFGSGAAWVANSLDGTVSRIDPTRNSVAATIPTGNGPAAVAVGSHGVWVSNQFGGTLARIDPRTNQVVRQISVGGRPQGVAVSGGTVLVSVRQSGAGHRGGTLTMRMNRDVDSIDTAVAYDSTSWSILRMTSDGLVAFNQASGLAGTQLVPDLAVSLPTPTDGGRTYTFQLRQIRYSNGKPVRASDFRSTLERDFRVGTPVPSYYDGIVGAARCEKRPKRCDLSHGIVADDVAKTVTFHLVAPDPEFLYKLALPFAYVVPAGIQPREVGTHPLPATGPYVIASYRPKQILRLVRNPYFHEWSKAAQPDGYPDEIVFEIGGTPDEAVNDVIRGKVDAFSTSQSQTPPSAGRLAAIKTQHASQVHTNPQPAAVGLFLNTRLAPFDHLDVRRALNYAADRAAAVKAAGGPDVAQATCQILPPHFPGYQPYCPYTAGTPTKGSWVAPNLARARALIARSGTRGMKITVWSWADLGGLGPYAVKLLRSLGYRASMKVRGGFGYFSVIGDSRTKAQMGTYEWISDYPAASGFFNAILSCASFLPNDPGNSNAAEFCDPRIDRQIGRALTEQATNPDAARGLWERIDRQTVDQAPWVALVNPKAVDVLSKRVGNYQYSPPLGMLIDQLWVR
jgi:YVTN family beta-propeller protein